MEIDENILRNSLDDVFQRNEWQDYRFGFAKPLLSLSDGPNVHAIEAINYNDTPWNITIYNANEVALGTFELQPRFAGDQEGLNVHLEAKIRGIIVPRN